MILEFGAEMNFSYWQTETKYYSISMQRDLLGDLTVGREWGSRFNKRGNSKISVADSREEALKMIKKIEHTRKQRGYSLVTVE